MYGYLSPGPSVQALVPERTSPWSRKFRMKFETVSIPGIITLRLYVALEKQLNLSSTSCFLISKDRGKISPPVFFYWIAMRIK